MWLGIYLSDDEAAARRERLRADEAFGALRVAVGTYLSGPNVLDGLVPGGKAADQLDPYTLGHTVSALAVYHGLEPDPEVASRLLALLRWTREQPALMWGQNISLGQFLKGVALALDAVGSELPADERRAIVAHLVSTCIVNPDPASLPNNHPTGAQPMLHFLEFPGFGFHLHDAQVNNWDVVCAQGLLLMARAVAAALPERAEEVAHWVAIARRRLERFLVLTLTPGGENGEGPGYYTYGTMAAVLMIEALRRWPGQRVAELRLEGLYATALWSRHLHPRDVACGTINVNDCQWGTRESPAVPLWIAARTRDAQAQAFGEALLRERLRSDALHRCLEEVAYALLWRDPDVASRPAGGRFARHFGRFGTVVARTGCTSGDVYVLMRCGDHAGAHTHPDRGSVLIDAYGEYLLSEGGCPVDRRTEVCKNYHKRTRAHNCARPVGAEQELERDGRFLGGQIGAFADRDGDVRATADLGAVYPGAGVVQRRLRVSPHGWVVLHDRFEHAPEGIEVLLHTDNRDRRAEVASGPGYTRISRPNASLTIIPLLDGNLHDLGTEYFDSDPEGQRALAWRTSGRESLLLLIPAPAACVAPPLVVALGERCWRVTVGGRALGIALDAPDGERCEL